jgi:hypothetical protein
MDNYTYASLLSNLTASAKHFHFRAYHAITNQQSNGWEVNVIGPSGVRALPLAAGINVGGHYKWHFFLFLSFFLPGSLLILPEGIIVGF